MKVVDSIVGGFILQRVRQGVIPAAGSGTRLGPFTNAIPKELLPVGEKAVIEHVVEAMRFGEHT